MGGECESDLLLGSRCFDRVAYCSLRQRVAVGRSNRNDRNAVRQRVPPVSESSVGRCRRRRRLVVACACAPCVRRGNRDEIVMYGIIIEFPLNTC